MLLDYFFLMTSDLKIENAIWPRICSPSFRIEFSNHPI